jgi:3-oxoacyl-[acyl-carrier-protein] synthase III
MKAGLRYCNYLLGEMRVNYTELPNYKNIIEENCLRGASSDWGWGDCWVLQKSFSQFVLDSFSIFSGEINDIGESIDCILICSPNTDLNFRFDDLVIGKILPLINSGFQFFSGISYCECTNILTAMHQAVCLINEGRGNVLILAADYIEEPIDRFTKFSVFSDFAMAILVSRNIKECKNSIIDSNKYFDATMHSENDLSQLGKIDKECVDRILSRNNLEIDAIDKYFCLNLYKPIVELKAQYIGFDENQLYLDNIPSKGHCFGADPIINFCTFIQKNESLGLALLNSTGSGQSASILVQGNGSSA